MESIGSEQSKTGKKKWSRRKCLFLHYQHSWLTAADAGWCCYFSVFCTERSTLAETLLCCYYSNDVHSYNQPKAKPLVPGMLPLRVLLNESLPNDISIMLIGSVIGTSQAKTRAYELKVSIFVFAAWVEWCSAAHWDMLLYFMYGSVL